MNDRVVRLGLLGCGTVGGGVLRLLVERAAEIPARVGAQLEVRRVLVRDITAYDDFGIRVTLHSEIIKHYLRTWLLSMLSRFAEERQARFPFANPS